MAMCPPSGPTMAHEFPSCRSTGPAYRSPCRPRTSPLGAALAPNEAAPTVCRMDHALDVEVDDLSATPSAPQVAVPPGDALRTELEAARDAGWEDLCTALTTSRERGHQVSVRISPT